MVEENKQLGKEVELCLQNNYKKKLELFEKICEYPVNISTPSQINYNQYEYTFDLNNCSEDETTEVLSLLKEYQNIK